MGKIISVLALGIVLLLGGFAASEPAGFVVFTQNKAAIDGLFEGGKLSQKYIDQMNEQAGQVPRPLVSLFGNNKINLHITADDGSVSSYYMSTESGKIVEVLKGTKGDADLEVRATEAALDKIANAKDPADAFLKAMGPSGGIKYTGLTPEGETKGLIVNVVTTVAGFFKGILDFFAGLFAGSGKP